MIVQWSLVLLLQRQYEDSGEGMSHTLSASSSAASAVHMITRAQQRDGAAWYRIHLHQTLRARGANYIRPAQSTDDTTITLPGDGDYSEPPPHRPARRGQASRGFGRAIQAERTLVVQTFARSNGSLELLPSRAPEIVKFKLWFLMPFAPSAS